MRNPWQDLPHSGEYVLDSDRNAVEGFNRTARPDFKYDINLMPEPFFGTPEAPIVVLNLNPGISSEEEIFHSQPAFMEKAWASLTNSLRPYPFLHLQDSITTPGEIWWRKRTRELEADTSLELVSKSLLCVQFFPYHSKMFSPKTPFIPSQEYGFHLVRNAMHRGSEIIIMRSKSLWMKKIPELLSYRNLHIAKNPRSPYISRGNLGGSYEKLLEKIRGI